MTLDKAQKDTLWGWVSHTESDVILGMVKVFQSESHSHDFSKAKVVLIMNRSLEVHDSSHDGKKC